MPICPRCQGTGEVINDRIVGSQYRSRRELLGIPLREIARRCGWSASYLSDLELGRRRWSTKQMQIVDEGLSLPKDWKGRIIRV